MTFSQNFIEEKLKELLAYFQEMKELFKKTDKEILGDISLLRHAERLLQLAVDTILDINQHFIKELKLPATDDFQSTFEILSDNKILSRDFAVQFAPVVGLRDRIVHRYESINKKLFISSFRKNLHDFDEYMRYIYKYVRHRHDN